MKPVLLTLSLLICLTDGYAQDHAVTIDLAGLYKTEVARPVPADLTSIDKVILENAFPNREYHVTVKTQAKVEPILTFGGDQSGNVLPTNCESLATLYKNIATWVTGVTAATSEKETTLRDTLKALTDLRKSSGCTDAALNKSIDGLLKSCTRTVIIAPGITINNNTDYVFTITAGTKAWTYRLTGESQGQWVMNYGFLFPFRSLEPDRYYLEQTGDESFEIRRRSRPYAIDFRFTPTIFFSYYFNKRSGLPWNHSLSFGAGVNSESPVASIGYNAMFHQNIGFSTGFVFYEQLRLDTRYYVGQVLKENLTEDKLYEKTYFRPNIFFAINVRLGKNPFTKETAKDAEDKKEESK